MKTSKKKKNNMNNDNNLNSEEKKLLKSDINWLVPIYSNFLEMSYK